ncbi:MAG: hypothetical protein V4857_04435 [Pseudomonadota bacterium]
MTTSPVAMAGPEPVRPVPSDSERGAAAGASRFGLARRLGRAALSVLALSLVGLAAPTQAVTLSCSNGGLDFDTGRYKTGTTDNRWTFVSIVGGTQGQVLAPPASGYAPASLVTTNSAWTTAAAGTAWISVSTSGLVSPGSTVNTYYRNDFDLDPAVLPGSVSLTMKYWSDNEVVGIWVNGVKQNVSGVPTCGAVNNGNYNYDACQGFTTANGRTATLSSDWKAGSNSLVIQIGDGGTITGFLANVQTQALCRPKLTVTKQTVGGFGGPFTFSGSAPNANGWVAQNLTTTAAGAPGATGATQTLAAANTLTAITETALPTGYGLASVSCTGLSGGATPTVSGNGFTLPAAGLNTQVNAGGIDAFCTVVNGRLPTLKVQKLSLAGFGGPFSFTQTNLASAPAAITTTALNTATPATPTAIMVNALNTAVTLTEAPAPGYVLTAASCTDANSAVTGNTGSFGTLAGNTLTIPAANVVATADFTCRFTNTKSTTLQLAKAWGANSAAADNASIGASSGGTNNTAAFGPLAGGTAGSSTTAVINTGNTITLPAETGTNIGNYNTTVACANATNAPSNAANGQAAGTLLIAAADAGDAIVCTYTNTRKTATLQLAKAWGANSLSTDNASIGASTGGTNNTTAFGPLPGGSAGNSGTAVTINAGNTITLPAETGTNIDDYTTTVACANAANAPSNAANGQAAGSLLVTAADAGKAIVCTYTNTRKAATLQLAKTWGANSLATDNASIGASGGGTDNTAAFGPLAGGTAGNSGPAVVINSGNSIVLPAETGTNLGNYTTTVACANAANAPSNAANGQAAGTLLIVPADAGKAIVCTYTNTRKAATLRLAKAWGTTNRTTDNALIGASGGGTNNTAAFGPLAGGTAGTSGTVAINAGNTIVLPAETGNNIDDYTTTVACSNAANVPSNAANGQASGSLLIAPADAGKAIVCTYTNTRKAATLQVAKAWGANSLVADNARIGATTGGTGNTAVLGPLAGGTAGATTAVAIHSGNTITLPAETGTNIGNYSTTVSCANAANAPSNAANGQAAGTLVIEPADGGKAIVCTYTNTRKVATLQLAKAWGADSLATDNASIGTSSGGTNNTAAFGPLAGGVAGNSGTAVLISVGNTITLPAETGTNIGNYNTTVACGNAANAPSNAANGQAAGTLLIATADAGKAIVCTYTNTRKAATLQLAKAWGLNSLSTDSASIGASGGGTNNTTAFGPLPGGTAGNSGTAVTINAGNTIVLPAETGSNIDDYATTVACANAANAPSNAANGQATGTLVVAAADAGKAIVCTYTNTRKAATLQLAKAWGANSLATDTASIGASGGGTNNTTAFGPLAGGTAGNSGAAVVINSGNTIALPAETGTNIGNYNTTVACANAANAPSNAANGQAAGTLLIDPADAGKAIVCTYTNTRKAATLQLAKTWGVNSLSSDNASIGASSGGTNNTSAFGPLAGGSAGNSGTAVTINAGNIITLPAETGNNIDDYATTVSCPNAANAPSNAANGQAAGTLLIDPADAGKAIVCTYTNTRKAATLQLAKAWGANSLPADNASIGASSGGTNNTAAFGPLAGGTAGNSGTAVVINSGNTITLPAETGTNIGNYNTTVSCANAANAPSNAANGQAAGTLVIDPTDAGKAIVCTYTNTRKAATLQLAKSWGANSLATDNASIGASSGGTNNTAAFGPLAGGTAGNSGTAVAINVGNTITLPAETGTNIGNYNTTITCANAANAPSNAANGQAAGTLLIDPADAGKAIVCTYTNTRKAATLQLAKAWGANNLSTDSASIGASSGGTTNTAAFGPLAGGTAGNSGTAVAINVGNTITLPAETGTNIGNYNTTVACANAANLPSNAANGQAAGTLLIAAADAGKAIVCTYTNTRKAATLQLAKAWGANNLATDNASIGASSGGTNNTAAFGPLAGGTAGNSGTAVVINSGNTITLPAETGTNIGNYNTSVACANAANLPSNAANGQAAGTLLIAAADAGKAIVCTYTNTRKAATLQLAKAWGANSLSTDNASIGASSGGTSNTAAFGPLAGGTTGNSGTAVAINVGNTITLPAETGTNIGNYNTTVACANAANLPSNAANGQGAGTLLIAAADAGKAIVCTYTNTRKAATLQLAKTWGANSLSTDNASIGASSGGTSNTAAFGPLAGGTAGNSGTAVAINVGNTIALPAETGTNIGNYNTTVACANAANLPSNAANGQAAGTLLIAAADAGKAIVCTYTNTRKAATLQLAKAWGANSLSTDNASIGASSGGTSNTAAFGPLAGGTTGNSGTAVAINVGNTITLPAETGTSIGNYTTTVACANAANAPSNAANGQQSGTLLIAAADAGKAIVCTYTNTRKAATLTLRKTWGASVIAGDQVSVASTGGTAQSAVTSTASANGTSNGSTVTVYHGDSITLPAEIFNTGSQANYTTTVSCNNSSGSVIAGLAPGVSFTVGNTDSALVCIYTNTLTAPTISFQKALGANRVVASDQFVLTASGPNAPASVTTTGSGTTIGSSPMSFVATAGSSYTLSESMAPGSGSGLSLYVASIACSDTNGVQTGLPGGTINASIGVSFTPVAGAKIVCVLTNGAGGITGRVFLDNGAGGGTANDGIKNGGEAGLSGIGVKLTNCAGSVLAAATTDGSGAYSFATPSATIGSAMCIEQTNAAGRVSVGASANGTALPSGAATSAGGRSYTYTRTTMPDRIAFAWDGVAHAGLDFGDVAENIFAAGGAKNGVPGGTPAYAHTFIAGTAGTVVFSVSGATATPALGGWAETVFADPACTGVRQPGATQLFPPVGAGQAVVAGQSVCVVVVESIPATAQNGNVNDATVQASFTYSNTAGSLSASYTLHDVTTAGSTALELLKEVRNVTQGGTFGVVNQAKSGETLEYRITYTNNATGAINTLTVGDATPSYTTFVSSDTLTTPASLTACAKNTPANPLPAPAVACATLQAVGGTGAVNWKFTGSLPAGGTGQVVFQVKVD